MELCETKSRKDLLSLTMVERWLELVDPLGMFGNRALKCLDQVPLVKLVGRNSAVVVSEGFDLIDAAADQEQMLCPSESQKGFTFLEKPFSEVLGWLNTA